MPRPALKCKAMVVFKQKNTLKCVLLLFLLFQQTGNLDFLKF